MKLIFNQKKSALIRTLGSLALLLALSACGTQNIKPSTDVADENTDLTTQDISELITQAQSLTPSERVNQLLLAASALYKLQELDWARNTLTSINTDETSLEQWLTYSLLQADISLAQGNPFKAKHHLWNTRLSEAVANADNETQKSFYDKRATLLYDISEYHPSVEQRIILGELINKKDEPEFHSLNQDLLWQALMALPAEDLSRRADTAEQYIIKGWYTLASLSKNSQTNLQQQLRAVDNWVTQWRRHPASDVLPADLQLLQQLVESQPNNIAVLLPLSGKLSGASQTILDGFMAAHYHTQTLGEKTPTVRIYDSTRNTINTVYDTAVSEGAEFIIGPLEKNNIKSLYLRGALPVPTLALNYIDTAGLASAPKLLENSSVDGLTQAEPIGGTPLQAPASDISANTGSNPIQPFGDDNVLTADGLEASNDETSTSALSTGLSQTNARAQLYQFGLALEDEAAQVAQRAYLDGKRRAMVIAPRTGFGQRGSTTFIQQWEALGGYVVELVEFNNQKEYSSIIENALGVRASKQRSLEIQRIIGNTDGFEPRRRQDIDMIFLLGRPSQARQLKPTLNFHYASDIPVYSTSHIYNGQMNNTLNRDMNNIQFTTLPWFFDESSIERKLIEQHGTQARGSAYYPLYAFGVDAYHLYPRLRQLKEVSQAHFYGSTGTLNITSGLRVAREQIWAKFSQGQAQPVFRSELLDTEPTDDEQTP